MFWYGNGMNGWGWGLMTFSSIVFWALVVLAVVLLVRHFARGGQRPPSGPPRYGQDQYGQDQYGPSGPRPASAEQVLAERFARGEIDDEEYRQRLATLRGADAAAGHGASGGRASGSGKGE